MLKFDELLTDILKKDQRFIDDKGELISSEIVTQALESDKELIKILLSDEEVKKKFEAAGAQVELK